MKPTLGRIGSADVRINVQALVETRLLVQANSGGGKSYLLRRLIEQTFGHVQQIIIDCEGEFASLREKFDFIIAAPHGGDALAHPRTAALLARRLLETGASAVIDIYDLKKRERLAFVRIFFDEVMNAPKDLWHPVLVILDEAHIFCPEKGQAESADAVKDMATRGRKRGYCLVPATQRLAKLHKDVAAEMINKLIGRTGIDVDVKRAADELGMNAKEALQALRGLNPGDFFAFGPAFGLPTQMEKIRVGDVVTTHPKAGSRGLKAPPKPTEAIKALLPKLADLPKEAEAEARTVDELRREIAQLKRQRAGDFKAVDTEKHAKAMDGAYRRGYEKAREEFIKSIGASRVGAGALASAIAKINESAEKFVETFRAAVDRLIVDHGTIERKLNVVAISSGRVDAIKEPERRYVPAPSSDNGSLPKGETAILTALIQFPNGLRREQLTVLTTYKKSSRDAYIVRLASRGLVETRGDTVVATEAGRDAIPNAAPLPTGAALQQHWMSILPEGERKILEVLIDSYPEPVFRETLEEKTGYKKSSRDAYIVRLRAKQLVEVAGGGVVAASGTLFQ